MPCKEFRVFLIPEDQGLYFFMLMNKLVVERHFDPFNVKS